MSRLLDVHNFVADKLRWQMQVLLDGGLTPNARMVGALLMHDLNVDRGAAWRAQENMAVALQVHVSTIRRGLAELAKAGHLSVRRSRGRGKTQQYAAIIIDELHAHDSIDAAVEARKSATEGDDQVSDESPEKVAGLRVDAPENLAGLRGDGSENLAGLRGDGSEKVAGLHQKGSRAASQTLYDPLNPPYPPERREANRVRSDWGVAGGATWGRFPDASVRDIVGKRLGEEGVRSWLDPHGWDPSSSTIVCRLEGAAKKLDSECGRDLRAAGVSVVFDKARFAEVERQGRPFVADLRMAS